MQDHSVFETNLARINAQEREREELLVAVRAQKAEMERVKALIYEALTAIAVAGADQRVFLS